MYYIRITLLFVAFACSLITIVHSHGMMLDPLGRASRWHKNESAPVNYDEDQLYCGGIGVQWSEQNQGKCGLCGDPYNAQTPRPHEFGGKYGEGVIVKTYNRNNSVIPVGVKLTTNHRGTFFWDLCNMDKDKESDECFTKNKLVLEDGSPQFKLKTSKSGWFKTTLKIPDGLQCDHCVLRWTYRAANNWGKCEDGTEGMGCGEQEHFRSCADIAIH